MNTMTTARTLREFNPHLNLRSSNPADWTRLGAPMDRADIDCEIKFMRESITSGRQGIEFKVACSAKWHTQMTTEGQLDCARDIKTTEAFDMKVWLQTNAIYLRKIGQADRYLSSN